ncbi:hypothetical protein HMPREF1624_02980 [Sporothrix schenckii ATCC 58251]|uniref:Xylanolytic transcriptional activator regulatory domain-containing protein n=2 Tax=Sporothrix schenckii TaxID=29908 RepID=U7PYS2_SPOS1|nr:hypothetical protein HMPREF1624_02980 [Sporothrix schenckii ATCC 58251]
MAAIRVDALPSPSQSHSRPYGSFSSMMAEEASLPPRQAADHLVETYFQHLTPHLPILERSHATNAINGAYRGSSGGSDSEQNDKDVFTTYMIFAIALCGVPGPSGKGRPVQSEGCFRSAIASVERAIVYAKSDIETLRSILLLAQFVALCPSQGSLWHLTGIALRMCIDIGLHWETDEQRLTMDPAVLRDRRRLWYTTYQFDRFLSITLGRPFGIIDESIRVELPNPWVTIATCRPVDELSPDDKFGIHSQRALNHVFKMTHLESEIMHVQHSQSWSVKIAYPRANYAVWLQDIGPRLQEWYTTIPEINKAHPLSIFACQAYWDTVYNNALLLLHRPNSMVSQVSAESLAISFDASCKMINSIKVLQRDGRVDVLWRAVHQLFMAGLSVIYCLWHSKDIRDSLSTGSCIQTLQSCASTLFAMSETLHGAAGCRDVFDTLSSATINWLITYDAEKVQQSRREFEQQLNDLLQNVQPSKRVMPSVEDGVGGGTALSAMTDCFAFSELLSSAAQWPELQGMVLGMDIEYHDLA